MTELERAAADLAEATREGIALAERTAATRGVAWEDLPRYERDAWTSIRRRKDEAIARLTSLGAALLDGRAAA